MNWRDIRKLFITACGEKPAATEESFLHLSEGQRRVAARLDLSEIETSADVATTASQDYIAIPSDCYHVITVFDVTHGLIVKPEESGMRSRSRFLEEATGKPVEGDNISNYAISGGRMYLRDTPDGIYTIRIRYKRALPDVALADLDSSPSLPAHLHMAIVHAATMSFYQNHMEADAPDERGSTMAARAEQALSKAIIEPQLPKDRERFDQRGRIAVSGFSFRRR